MNTRTSARWLALGTYCVSIIAANWLIENVGPVVLPNGTHLAPAGFGLLAPSGAYAAGVTFVARDVVQRTAGRLWALAAIVAGTVLSVAVSPQLALASGGAFLFSELVDFAVYTPLQRRSFVLAVFASGLVGSAVDSALFLTLAEIPLTTPGSTLPYSTLLGLVLAKFWVQLLAIPVAVWIRERVPTVEPAPA